jgi:iron complex outermembrane receptor protein
MMLSKRLLLQLMLCIAAFFPSYEVHAQDSATPSLSGDSVVLSQGDIQTLNVHSVVELLNRLPGVSASNSSVSLQGSSSKSVLVLLDGRPLNNPVSGQVDLGALSADRIAELRMIKGSGAVRYGDNTSGGVILITTSEPVNSTSRKVELHYGSYNSSELSAEMSTSIHATGLELGLNRDSSDGHRENGDSLKTGATFALSRTFSPTLGGRLALTFDNGERGYAGKVLKPTPEARKFTNNRSSLLKVKFRKLESSTYYNIFKINFINPDSNIANRLNTTVFGQELRFNGPFSVGLKYELLSADSSDFGIQREQQQSAFLFNRYALFGSGDKAITAGVRVNRHSEFGITYNPQLGFSYNSSPFTLALEVSRSSNTPTFKQRFSNSTYARPNPGLGMETSSNVKASFSYAVSDTATLDISGFYNKIDNTITYVSNVNGTYSYQNIDSSRRRGIDASFDWQITPMFRFNISYLFLNFTDDATGLDMPRKPRHKAKLNLDITHAALLVTVTGKWVSNSFDDKANSVIQAGYITLDTNIAYNLGKTQLLFSIENMLDEYYEYHKGIPHAGRTFKAGIRHLF